MKPFRKQTYARRPAAQPETRAAPPAPAVLHRYAHPIRTSRPAAPAPADELLADVLDSLSRQSAQLDEILNFLRRNNSDTQ